MAVIKKTKEGTINWLKAALKRQQEFQQEVKRKYAAIIVENRNPKLAAITADFEETASMLSNKPE